MKEKKPHEYAVWNKKFSQFSLARTHRSNVHEGKKFMILKFEKISCSLNATLNYESRIKIF